MSIPLNIVPSFTRDIHHRIQYIAIVTCDQLSWFHSSNSTHCNNRKNNKNSSTILYLFPETFFIQLQRKRKKTIISKTVISKIFRKAHMSPDGEENFTTLKRNCPAASHSCQYYFYLCMMQFDKSLILLRFTKCYSNGIKILLLSSDHCLFSFPVQSPLDSGFGSSGNCELMKDDGCIFDCGFFCYMYLRFIEN